MLSVKRRESIKKTFAALKREAAEWYLFHMADLWRVVASMGPSGYDRLDRYFNRPASEISNSDIVRWRAACVAAREQIGG